MSDAQLAMMFLLQDGRAPVTSMHVPTQQGPRLRKHRIGLVQAVGGATMHFKKVYKLESGRAEPQQET